MHPAAIFTSRTPGPRTSKEILDVRQIILVLFYKTFCVIGIYQENLRGPISKRISDFNLGIWCDQIWTGHTSALKSRSPFEAMIVKMSTESIDFLWSCNVNIIRWMAHSEWGVTNYREGQVNIDRRRERRSWPCDANFHQENSTCQNNLTSFDDCIKQIQSFHTHISKYTLS